MIPLILKLKKEAHKNLAEAQDIIIEELYKVFENAVFHGGTAIWRCYNGNRFSEDIDVYIKKDGRRLKTLFENFKKRGFTIEKKRIKENSLYSILKWNRTIVRFEALFKQAKGSLKEYKKVENNIMMVYSLTPEQLVTEKVNAYLKRLKIRDLYDVFFLIRHIKDKKRITHDLKKLVKNFKEPTDSKELKILVFEGIVPNETTMLNYIKSYI